VYGLILVTTVGFMSTPFFLKEEVRFELPVFGEIPFRCIRHVANHDGIFFFESGIREHPFREPESTESRLYMDPVDNALRVYQVTNNCVRIIR